MYKVESTHKFCELFVGDAAVGSLKALRVWNAAIGVDVTETDGGQDLHGGRLLQRQVNSKTPDLSINICTVCGILKCL